MQLLYLETPSIHSSLQSRSWLTPGAPAWPSCSSCSSAPLQPGAKHPASTFCILNLHTSSFVVPLFTSSDCFLLLLNSFYSFLPLLASCHCTVHCSQDSWYSPGFCVFPERLGNHMHFWKPSPLPK